MTLEDNIIYARRCYDMHAILGTNKRQMVCPLPIHHHVNNTPSFSIFWKDGHQRFLCHGSCGKGGDVVDLVGYLNISSYNSNNVLDRQAALSYLDSRFEMKEFTQVKDNKLRQSRWLDFMPISDKARDYALSRGLNHDTINKFKLGEYKDSSGEWLSIPIFENEYLRGIKLRNLSLDSTHRFKAIKGSRIGMFNLDAVAYKAENVFVVKGEIPCMILDQLGYLACAPSGGEASWSKEWSVALSLSSAIVIGDNDNAGKTLGAKRASLLNARLVFPPDPYKDWDEIYIANQAMALNLLEEWSKHEVEVIPFL